MKTSCPSWVSVGAAHADTSAENTATRAKLKNPATALAYTGFASKETSTKPTLIVVSYRDDEVGTQHPLRVRLGELSSTIRCRVTLPELTVQAVTELALDTDFDPVELHRATHGNAFFVTEIVNSRSETLPQSIRDAVIARASRLPEYARRPLDAASIVPGRVEPRSVSHSCSEVGSRAGVACSAPTAVPVDTQHRCIITKLTATGFDHGLCQRLHCLASMKMARSARISFW